VTAAEDGGDMFPGKSVHRNLHGATFQKTAFFIVTAVKISNLTMSKIFKLLRNMIRNYIHMHTYKFT
jgi:hypothetical protein